MRGGAAIFMLVMMIGASGMMLSLSGFGQAWGAEPPQTNLAQKGLHGSAANLKPQNAPISGPVSSSNAPIIGLLASGLGSFVSAAGAVALLPMTLVHMGFPRWFAYPLGLLAYIIVGISIIEFAVNREWY